MVQVIGAGFGRTGTASLKAALEHVGFGPCYHMFEVLAEPVRAAAWERALDGKDPDWPRVFDGYQSTVDWPGCAYWGELAEAYPDAKVLLSVRDPQRWYDSVHETIYQFAKLDPGESEAFDPRVHAMVRRLIWDGTFDGRFADRAHAIEVFEQHNESVRQGVPAERLLEYGLGQGWQPLCRFLGVEIPDQPFPHVNDAGSIKDLVDRVRAEGAVPSPFSG